MARLEGLLARDVGDEAALAGNTRGVHHRPLVERLHLLHEATAFRRSLRHDSVERLRFQPLVAQLLLSAKRAIIIVTNYVRVVLVASGSHNLLILQLRHVEAIADLRAVATEALW